MKKLILLLILSPITFFSQGPVDGYMKSKKDYSVGLSFAYEKANELFAGTDKIGFNRTTTAVSLFGIYGISNMLNIQVNLPFVSVNSGAESSLQDASVYLKYSLLNKENSKGFLRLMAAAGYAMPIANYQTNGGNALGQRAKVGDGRIVIQQNFKNNFFASLQGGYFLKSNPTPNAASTSLKIGYAGSFYADLWFEVLNAFGGNDYMPGKPNADFRSFGFSYQKIGGTFYHSITKHIGGFAGASYVLNGRNAFQNTGFNLGIVFQ
ncbi:MAG: hypothetical protein ACPGVD_03460 [Flavobacteriales bacterium]